MPCRKKLSAADRFDPDNVAQQPERGDKPHVLFGMSHFFNVRHCAVLSA